MQKSRYTILVRKNALLPGVGLVLLLAIFCFPLRLHSEETIRHVYMSTMPEQDLEDLLYLAIGIELTRAGFTSTLSAVPADYRLAAHYERGSDAVYVSLSLARDSEGAATMAETDFRLFLDATFDAVIAESVSVLLSEAGIETVPTIDAEIEGLLSKQAELPAGSGPKGSTGLTAGQAADKISLVEGRATAFIDTCFAVGGMALFGAATDYFHYGAFGSFRAGYAFPLGKVTVTPGLRVSVTRIFNDAGVSGNPLFLSTIGANLLVGTGNNIPYRVSFASSAGAAVLSIVSAGRLLSKTVPYMDFGTYSAFPLGGGFFMGGEVRFLLVFDKEIFMMGAVPVLTLSKEF